MQQQIAENAVIARYRRDRKGKAFTCMACAKGRSETRNADGMPRLYGKVAGV